MAQLWGAFLPPMGRSRCSRRLQRQPRRCSASRLTPWCARRWTRHGSRSSCHRVTCPRHWAPPSSWHWPNAWAPTSVPTMLCQPPWPGVSVPTSTWSPRTTPSIRGRCALVDTDTTLACGRHQNKRAWFCWAAAWPAGGRSPSKWIRQRGDETSDAPWLGQLWDCYRLARRCSRRSRQETPRPCGQYWQLATDPSEQRCCCRRRCPPDPHHQRLLRDLAQGRCLARLGPGVWRDARSLRLPTCVIGVALLRLASSLDAVARSG